MTITFTLPLVGNKPSTSKDLVLSILTEKHPLTLIELQHAMHKQYGKIVSFQSVRQAVLELEAAKVLTRDGKRFALSKTWIRELILFGNKLQTKYLTPNSKDTLSVGPNVTVYTLSRMAEADEVWNQLIKDIFADVAQPRSYTFTGLHFWFLLVTLAQETALVKEQMARGVSLHFICYSDTPIDLWSIRHYNDIGVRSMYVPKPADFTPGLNIGSYGNYVIQIQYPEAVQKKLDEFYARNKRIEDAKLDEIVAIISQEGIYQLTVINDPILARNFRESVIGKFTS